MNKRRQKNMENRQNISNEDNNVLLKHTTGEMPTNGR
jgi:hypothetical protein